jgi:hypothetical protein
LQVRSKTRTDFAPAARHISATATTNSGSVFAACSGVRSHPMLGLRTITSPRETNDFIPPSSATALRARSAGLAAEATATSAVFPAAARSTGGKSADAANTPAAPPMAWRNRLRLYGHPFMVICA